MKYTEVAPGLLVPGARNHIPLGHIEKARSLIARFRCGKQEYKKIKLRGSGYWKINLSGPWRLLSRNKGKTWELMRHEHYLQEIHRCCR